MTWSISSTSRYNSISLWVPGSKAFKKDIHEQVLELVGRTVIAPRYRVALAQGQANNYRQILLHTCFVLCNLGASSPGRFFAIVFVIHTGLWCLPRAPSLAVNRPRNWFCNECCTATVLENQTLYQRGTHTSQYKNPHMFIRVTSDTVILTPMPDKPEVTTEIAARSPVAYASVMLYRTPSIPEVPL